MRPSHPLPRPTNGPTVPDNKEKENEEKEKKRKRKSVSDKPLTRARRITIDPSRYGAVHLSGLVLDDGTEDLPKGVEWECEENEESDIKWILRDKEGSVLKEEVVKQRKGDARKDVYFESDAEDSDGDESESESESSMDEVAAAINDAASDSSSESDEEESSKRDIYASSQAKTVQVKPFEIPKFDPGEESDFSEGYQEVQADTRPPPQDWKEEKAGHLDLLKNMFGTTTLSSASQPVSLAKPLQSDESEDEDIMIAPIEESAIVESVKTVDGPLTGAQKRAALLGRSVAGNELKSFQPMVRFDPGISDGPHEEDEVKDAEEPKDDVEIGSNQIRLKEVINSESSRADLVQMSSLKDMFRPKEDTTGFSLLGDLDLDLEEEEEDDELEEPQVAPVQNRWITNPARLAPPPTNVERLPFFFPLPENGNQTWLSILQRDPTVSRFCKDKTDEELQTQWRDRKGQLTQDYKRRHREALKKKKRKYTGSRAAGTSMPSRF